MNLVFGIILLVAAVFLVVAVLMQSGKDNNLSGTIAGGAETFFGKTKGKTADKILNKLTAIVAVAFVLLVIVVYVIQPNTAFNADKEFDNAVAGAGDTEAVETSATTAETGAAETDAPVAETDAPAAETDAPATDTQAE